MCVCVASQECISHSAVKTKFEQHTKTATDITNTVKDIMDEINIASAEKRCVHVSFYSDAELFITS